MLNDLKVWFGLVILLAGLAYWVIQKPENNDVISPQPLVSAWQQDEAAIGTIDQIVLSQGDNQLLLTKSNDDDWVLNDGFYAATEPLVKLFRTFQSAQIVEAKTANPNKHDQLELAEEDMLVKFLHSGRVEQAFYVGKRSAAGVTFVRRANENQTYTVSDISPISISSDNWRLKTVMDIAAEEIQSVKLNAINGEEIRVERNPENNNEPQLLNIPTGQQLKPDAYLDQVFNGLSRLMIDEAVPADSWPEKPSNASEVTEIPLQLVAKYQLFSGHEIELKAYQYGDSHFMTIKSEQFARYNDWVMEIAEYKFNALNRNLSEFIEPINPADAGHEINHTYEVPGNEDGDD